MIQNTSHLKYRADIDGLRAIAVLSVVIFHAFPQYMPGGFVGVDIFFVISGFLISTLLFKDFERSEFSYADFYSRRIKRIFPALVIVLLTTLGLGWFLLLSEEFAQLGRHLFSSVLFVQNINLVRESGYFDSSSDLKPLLHLWSLAVEEQFYIIWPVILTFAFKVKKSSSIVLYRSILIFLMLSFVINLLKIEKHPTATFYEIQTRLWELMAGGLLAYLNLYRHHKYFTSQNKNILSICGCGLLIISFIIIDHQKSFPGFWALLPIVGSFLIIGVGPEALINRFLARRFFVAVGLISYPLYLWHWPLLSIARILSPEVAMNTAGSWKIKSACLLISILLSIATYLFLEKPIRKQKFEKPILNKLILSLLSISVIIGALGLLIQSRQGYKARAAAIRKDGPLTSVNPFQNTKALLDCSERLKLPGIEWCLSSEESDSADIVVIGDSHAGAFAPALLDYYKNKNRSLKVFGTGDTIGLLDAGSVIGGSLAISNGIRSMSAAFEWTLNHPVQTVFLISRGPIYYEGRGFGVESRQLKIKNPNDLKIQNSSEIYVKALDKTMATLLNQNKEIIFIYEQPELGFLPKDMCYRRPVEIIGTQILNPCAVSRSEVLKRQSGYRKAVASVLSRYPQVKTFDPMQSLCDDQLCYAVKNGILLYEDHHHLSAEGASWLLQKFNF